MTWWCSPQAPSLFTMTASMTPDNKFSDTYRTRTAGVTFSATSSSNSSKTLSYRGISDNSLFFCAVVFVLVILLLLTLLILPSTHATYFLTPDLPYVCLTCAVPCVLALALVGWATPFTTTRETVTVFEEEMGILVEQTTSFRGWWWLGGNKRRTFLEACAVREVLILEQITNTDVIPYLAFIVNNGDDEGAITPAFTKARLTLDQLEEVYRTVATWMPHAA